MSGITPLPFRLGTTDRRAITEHFLALDREDRRLRFGAFLSDEALNTYEERIDFEHDEIFAIAGDDLRLRGVVHVAFYPNAAELGLSVLPEARGLGLGDALFSRAVMHLTNRGVREVFVHCLSENGAMMHLARKNGMRVVYDGSETDARLALPTATPQSILNEWYFDHNARFAQAVRRSARSAITALSAMAPGPAGHR